MRRKRMTGAPGASKANDQMAPLDINMVNGCTMLTRTGLRIKYIIMAFPIAFMPRLRGRDQID